MSALRVDAFDKTRHDRDRSSRTAQRGGLEH